MHVISHPGVLQGSASAQPGSGQQACGTRPGVAFTQTHDFAQLLFLWPLSKGLGGHLHPCDTKHDGQAFCSGVTATVIPETLKAGAFILKNLMGFRAALPVPASVRMAGVCSARGTLGGKLP